MLDNYNNNSKLCLSHILNEFRSKMAEQEIRYSGEIYTDTNSIVRFHVDGDKRGSLNGFYILHTDGIAAGMFGSWKINGGKPFPWCIKEPSSMTPEERTQHQAIAEFQRRKRNELIANLQAEAAKRAARIWHGSELANAHNPYLAIKNIHPHTARMKNNRLILPLTNFRGEICSLQFIARDCDKKLLKHGAKKGNFIPVQLFENPSRILICEGFATGATLAESYPNDTVIAAIDAGNLKSVAEGARAKWPNTMIVICGDDDRIKADNIGVRKAHSAALAIDALVAFPLWPENAPTHLSDFNDLMSWSIKNEGARNE